MHEGRERVVKQGKWDRVRGCRGQREYGGQTVQVLAKGVCVGEKGGGSNHTMDHMNNSFQPKPCTGCMVVQSVRFHPVKSANAEQREGQEPRSSVRIPKLEPGNQRASKSRLVSAGLCQTSDVDPSLMVGNF